MIAFHFSAPALRNLWKKAAPGFGATGRYISKHPRVVLVPLSVFALALIPGDAGKFLARPHTRSHVTRRLTPMPDGLKLAYPAGFRMPPMPQDGKPPQSALVIKIGDAKPIFSFNADQPRYPASTTKLMTLYLLFQEMKAGRITPDQMLKVSAHADSMPPSLLVVPSHEISAHDVVMTIITRSANNMAVVAGEAIAGSEPAFAAKMNAMAKKLGLAHTYYFNASGLPDAGRDNVTTAEDLAKLAVAIKRDFPEYARWFDTPVYNYHGIPIENHNHLLGEDGFDGMKTGYIKKAGFNVVASFKNYIVVVIGGTSWEARDHTAVRLACDDIPGFAGTHSRACAAPTRGKPEKVPFPLPTMAR